MKSGEKSRAGNTPRPWVIYVRVSTDEQAKKGTSLETQEAGCRGLATAYGHTVSEVIVDDGYSAAVLKQKGRRSLDAFLKRPGAKRLLDLIERGSIAGVIIWKLGRLVRNTRQLLEVVELMQERDIAFVSVNDRIDTSTAMGRMILTIIGALDQLESEQISERVVAVLDYMRSQGRWAGGTVPAGLTVEVRNGKERYLVADPRWGAVVAQGWTMVLNGASLRMVAEHYTSTGVPLKSRKPWSMAAVSKLLRSKRYVGVLVEQEAFDRVAAVLSSRVSPGNLRKGLVPTSDVRSTAKISTDRVWRLQQLAFCARCGSALIGVTARGSGGVYAYLRCTGRVKRGTTFCAARDLPAEPWEDAVVARLVQYARTEGGADLARRIAELVAKHQAEAAPVRAEHDEVRLERDRLQQRLAVAMEAALASAVAARAYAPQVERLQADVEALNVRLAALAGRLAAAELTMDNVTALAGIMRDELTRIGDHPWDMQKRDLRQLVQRVELGSGMPCRILLWMPELLGSVPPIPGHLDPANAAAAGGSGGGAEVRSPHQQWLRRGYAERTSEAIAIPLRVEELQRGGKRRGIAVRLLPEDQQSQPAPDRVD